MRHLLLLLGLVLAAPASERGGDFLPSARRPEPQAKDVPAQIAGGVARNPGRWLGPLAEHLVRNIGSDFVKAKSIHDWIALNIRYDVADTAPEIAAAGSFLSALTTGRSACGGYTTLFAQMCSLAGLECVTITGYARSHGMDVFVAEDLSRANHAWNAVRLSGDWRLVDPTWDAGRVRDGVFEQAYSTDYLFSGPQMFSYTHFPDDPQWQLRHPPMTRAEFARQPSLRAEFHTLGLRLVGDLKRVNDVSGPAVVELNVPDDVSVYGRLLSRDGSVILAQLEPEREPGRVRFSLHLAEPGERILAVYASPDLRSGRHIGVAFIGFRRVPDGKDD